MKRKRNRNGRSPKVDPKHLEIQAENQKLRRENARLRKELDKRLSFVEGKEDMKPVKKIKAVVVAKPVCSDCGHESFKTFVTPGGKTLISCAQCKTKQG